jgi:hypothetical protein
MTSTQLVPLIIVPFLAWRVYSRVRRNIGRQPFHPGRLVTRIVLWSVISVLFALGTMGYLPSLEALAGGLLLALPLAFIGTHLTKFEDTPQGKFYTPNTAIGVALIVLFMGRVAYRMYALYTLTPTLTGRPTPEMFQSPITLFIYGLTGGYYIAYNAAVLIRSHKPAA